MTHPDELSLVQAESPSGVTAIITGVLAGLGALLTLGNGILGLIGFAALAGDAGLRTLAARSPGVLTLTILTTLLSVGCGLLLLAGTVTLLQRKMISRRLIVGGCVLIILGSLISLGLSFAATARYEANALAFLSLALPIATIVLALLPSTSAWIRAKQNPIASQADPD
ncbi:lysylphosphatidylglycerol synthetase-like protein (DUF2156 family) [Mycobacterium frederiksbergense]|uniref:Lysylphosphatidylglycerol synthetase-like protein (DUF2156 family) n=1 Tax=Mycolicibacterium frederiksbergense TaxID=117567 RepID=A0ABT6KY05_9MYCO|nr:hypothetical protein [Mycolicibacterium frederiksbergense]MDH6195594.1 lysylphosphatidylglycerol synthetase-like protein (DUF2156 family) [Mycolicibacterium frederiksbergense]